MGCPDLPLVLILMRQIKAKKKEKKNRKETLGINVTSAFD